MDKQMAINRSLFFSFGSGKAWYRALKIQHGCMSNQTRTFNTDSGTILQALDFISHILMGDVQAWLDNRGWGASDLICKLRKETNISIAIDFRIESGDSLAWITVFNRTHLRCGVEKVFLNQNIILHSNGHKYSINDKPSQDIAFMYEGSLLSQLKPSELPAPINEFLYGMRKIRSLELLSPHLMRKRARTNDQDIGSGGEKLSSYLHGIKGEARNRLIELLKRFYPNLIDYKISSLRSGWKKLTVIEQFGARKLETEASHLSDGLLRILAILAQSESSHSLILLDEIENGINPEIIEKLVNTLVECKRPALPPVILLDKPSSSAFLRRMINGFISTLEKPYRGMAGQRPVAGRLLSAARA